MAEDTELVNLGGLFRNTSKKGDVYYSGKTEDGDQYVLFRCMYGNYESKDEGRGKERA